MSTLLTDNSNGREEKFSQIYKENLWKGRESRSGPSSSMARTEEIRKSIPELISKLRVKTVVDAPCGDFYWMSHVAHDAPNVIFKAMDIVQAVITENKTKWSSLSNVHFDQADLVVDRLPKVDLLISRDFLFHLSYEHTRLFLKNFLSSGTPWLLTTSHRSGDWENRDILTGGWRWMDLTKTPYGFPQPSKTLKDGEDRFLFLFDRHQIASLGFLMMTNSDNGNKNDQGQGMFQ